VRTHCPSPSQQQQQRSDRLPGTQQNHSCQSYRTDDATASGGASAAVVRHPHVAVAGVQSGHGHLGRPPGITVCRPDGAVRARADERRPVVAGAQAEDQAVRAQHAAVPHAGILQRNFESGSAGGPERYTGSYGNVCYTATDGEDPVVGHQRELHRVRTEHRHHVLHVQQRVVCAVTDRQPYWHVGAKNEEIRGK